MGSPAALAAPPFFFKLLESLDPGVPEQIPSTLLSQPGKTVNVHKLANYRILVPHPSGSHVPVLEKLLPRDLVISLERPCTRAGSQPQSRGQ